MLQPEFSRSGWGGWSTCAVCGAVGSLSLGGGGPQAAEGSVNRYLHWAGRCLGRDTGPWALPFYPVLCKSLFELIHQHPALCTQQVYDWCFLKASPPDSSVESSSMLNGNSTGACSPLHPCGGRADTQLGGGSCSQKLQSAAPHRGATGHTGHHCRPHVNTSTMTNTRRSL